MRIYIVGSVASGKTTFARKISKVLNIECVHLDGVVHIKDSINKKWGNTRRTDQEIDRIFSELINKSSWIIEDAGRKCFAEGLERADYIIYLKPSVMTRRIRIMTRFIKQKLGLEDCLYTPNLRMLKAMYIWTNNYEQGKDNLEERINQYSEKITTLISKREIEKFLSTQNTMKNQ